jgi:isopentenyl diphosphate isomerase/L-lactate dehydrogenase-like FMN-dependent dehydrogenase
VEETVLESPQDAVNVSDFEVQVRRRLTKLAHDYLAGGADDEKTILANRQAFDVLKLRARRLVDVSEISTAVELLGQPLETPIILAPVGFLRPFHPQGELAVARAAASRQHLMIASTVSSYPIGEIVDAGKAPAWFQLYPTPDRGITRQLLASAEAAGCPVVVLTADTPVLGNRESQIEFLRSSLLPTPAQLGNFADIDLTRGVTDPSMTWEMIGWLRSNANMKVVIKGIVTAEDAELCVEHGADALIVSNHGGRQEESLRGAIECLPEVVEAVGERIPVLVDGGIRRGTDIFKALALGARAVCIGRPYVWGLTAFGQAGVERVLDILDAELVRIMQLCGTPAIADITPSHVCTK